MPSHGKFRYQVGEPFYFYSIIGKDLFILIN